MEKKLFITLSILLTFLAMVLTLNLYLQWSNYESAISNAIGEQVINHAAVLSYSRAMDFSFYKTCSMFLGFILVFIGTLFLLRTHEAAYSLGAKSKELNLTLQTTSPGLVIVTLGVMVVIATIYKDSMVGLTVTSLHKPLSKSIVLKDEVAKITFDKDSVSLNDSSKKALRNICLFMNQKSQHKFTVEGWGDKGMIPELAIALGERRAKAISTYMEESCRTMQTATISYGEEQAHNTAPKNKISISIE